MIYLDNNATTAIDPAVIEAIVEVWKLGPLNPSSQHAAGRRARVLLDRACAEIARHLGADIVRTGGPRLLLTSGGTESNNWAIRSLVDSQLPLWTSAIEHPSVLAAAAAANRQGRSVRRIAVDPEGRVRCDALAASLEETLGPPSGGVASGPISSGRPPGEPPRGLVSVMAANHETGVVQPIAEIVPICRRFGVRIHTDATQAIGKIPFDFTALGIDAATFAAHKIHGPSGVGGLLVAPDIHLDPLLVGGEQQLGSRPGTEAVAMVVGMAKAISLAVDSLAETAQRVSGLRDHFEGRLREAIRGCVVHGRNADRLPGTSCVSFPGVDRQSLLIALDMAGVACSTGSACSSGSSQPSPVLEAMGVEAALVEAALRFGISRLSTTEEVSEAAERIIHSYSKLATA